MNTGKGRGRVMTRRARPIRAERADALWWRQDLGMILKPQDGEKNEAIRLLKTKDRAIGRDENEAIRFMKIRYLAENGLFIWPFLTTICPHFASKRALFVSLGLD
jgi:hypothetical protein